MATSTKQVVATVPVYDYLLNPGDAVLTGAPSLAGKQVKVTLAYDKARSISPVTWLENLTVYSTKTDQNGFWQVNVVPTDNITPANTYYIVEVEGYLSYKINPILAGVPGVGWQSSAILLDIPASLTPAGQTITGPLTVTGTLAVTGLFTVVSSTGMQVDALGNVSARSFTAGVTSPYTSNLPGTGGGGQLAATPTPGGVLTGKTWDWGGERYSVYAAGAKGDGVTDDTTALRATAAAAIPTRACMALGTGTFAVTGTITLTQTLSVRGMGAQGTAINYSGSGYCFDFPTNLAANSLIFEDFSIACTSAATGAIRLGQFANATGAYFSNGSINRLVLTGPGPTQAGTIALSLTQLAGWEISQVHVQNFETCYLFDRCTANNTYRLRAQAFTFGFNATAQGTQSGGQNQGYFWDILGPALTAPATGYGIKIDDQGWTLEEPFYEPTAGNVGRAFLWITINGNWHREIGANYIPNATMTNSILIDTGCSEAYFIGCRATGVIPAMSIAAPGILGGFNGNHAFISCGTLLTGAIPAAAITSGYVQVMGPGYRTIGGTARQVPEIAARALVIPSQIYNQPGDPVMVTAAQGTTTAGTIAAGIAAQAGTGAPTPVLVGSPNDRRGSVTFGTGTVAANGNGLVYVNFSKPYFVAPSVIIGVRSGTAAQLPLTVSSVGVNGFIVQTPSAVPLGQANTAYGFDYIVEG